MTTDTDRQYHYLRSFRKEASWLRFRPSSLSSFSVPPNPYPLLETLHHTKLPKWYLILSLSPFHCHSWTNTLRKMARQMRQMQCTNKEPNRTQRPVDAVKSEEMLEWFSRSRISTKQLSDVRISRNNPCMDSRGKYASICSGRANPCKSDTPDSD